MIRNFLPVVALLGLAACGDPLDRIDRLADVDLADVDLAEAQAATLVAEPGDQAGDAPILPALLADAGAGAAVDPADPAPDPAIDPAADSATAIASANTAADGPAAPAPAARGFLGLFSRPGGATGGSLAAQPASDGPDAMQVAPGQVLPYGEIATVCGLSDAALGPPIAAASGLAIHDSAPGSITLRSHYITGFPDGCARQFTAALAIFGDVGTHEVVRYQPSNASIAYTATDLAYEEIKGRICRVPAGQPCGDRLEQLGRNTAFVTVYERFGSAPVWAEILIHDGAVVAMDVKRN